MWHLFLLFVCNGLKKSLKGLDVGICMPKLRFRSPITIDESLACEFSEFVGFMVYCRCFGCEGVAWCWHLFLFFAMGWRSEGGLGCWQA